MTCNMPDELEGLLSALMAGGQPVELALRADRLERAMGSTLDVQAGVLSELRTAIHLVRTGEPCAAVTALLTARSAMVTSSR